MLKTSHTDTAAGRIDHYRLKGMTLPVKILTVAYGDHQIPRLQNGLPLPVVKRGRFVYALPGGGEFTS